jgi:Cu(I)/Ag(I) efflux system periplasmic protein CusF
MKHLIVLLAALAVMPGAFAQSMKGMEMKDMPMKGMDKKGAQGKTHKATGVVTKIEKNNVTIKHGPVPSMNWPSMTMAFKVKDKALMERMKKDQKVDFEFVQEGRDHVVTAVN